MMQDTSKTNLYATIPNSLLDSKLDAYEGWVYVQLASFSDWSTGECYPSQDTLAKRMLCDEKTVRRALEGLVSKGVIRKERRKTEEGRDLSCRYFLMERISTTKSKEGGSTSLPGGSSSRRRGDDVPPQGGPRPDELVSENKYHRTIRDSDMLSTRKTFKRGVSGLPSIGELLATQGKQ